MMVMGDGDGVTGVTGASNGSERALVIGVGVGDGDAGGV